MHACRMAAGADPGAWGPAASGPVRQLDITVRFEKKPGVSGAVSAGTLGSIVEIFSDPDARIVGDPAGLLPNAGAAVTSAVRRSSPLHVRLFVRAGRLIGPLVPVAFLNPPVLHPTASPTGPGHAAPHRHARVRESLDHGALRAGQTIRSVPGQVVQSVAQRGIATATRLPPRVEKQIAAVVRGRLPTSDTGPSGTALDGWSWSVNAEAGAASGHRAAATLSGSGHPGYTATAAMPTALGLHLADLGHRPLVPGVVTPAVRSRFRPAISPHLSTPELSLRVDPHRPGGPRRRPPLVRLRWSSVRLPPGHRKPWRLPWSGLTPAV